MIFARGPSEKHGDGADAVGDVCCGSSCRNNVSDRGTCAVTPPWCTRSSRIHHMGDMLRGKLP